MNAADNPIDSDRSGGPLINASDSAWVRARRWTIALCAGLLIAFATLAWTAAAGKSPTADEPYHALAGWLQRWHGEYRFISDHPPLWSMLASALTTPNTIKVDRQRLNEMDLPMDSAGETAWTIQTLFRTPGNDAAAFIARFRIMMLAVAVSLGALLAGFVWRIARALGVKPTAAAAGAVLATGVFAFDPNFLAHSPLVKNDVAAALALLALTASTWAAGCALTLRRILILGVCSGVAMSVKFNGPLLIGSSASLLFLRAILPFPWIIGIRRATAGQCNSRAKRLQIVSIALALMAMITFASIWLSYGLRFAPGKEPGAQMNMPRLVIACLVRLWEANHWDGTDVTPPTQQQGESMPKPAIVSLVTWANKWRLLPQAFLGGLLDVYQAAQTRGTFLYGQSSNVGTWWYFPFAIAVKTPIATLAALLSVAIAAIVRIFRRMKDGPIISGRPILQIEIWTALCLSLPVVIYLGASVLSNLNLGIRHVLPVYPLLIAAIGLAVAKLWDCHSKMAMVAGVIVITTVAIESSRAYPNYIPFFNAMAGGSRGGLRLLSDSNLDWGQDLPLLAQWQRNHPDQKLYLAYFGTADPAYYGIRYTNVLDGYIAGPPPQPITAPGVFAISATTLQGPYCGQTFNRPTWYPLWKLKPFEVLGGSIYLFHVPPVSADHQAPGKSLIN